jgi:hypothetical protein
MNETLVVTTLRWPHNWPKHFGDYYAIKSHSYTQVQYLVFLKKLRKVANFRSEFVLVIVMYFCANLHTPISNGPFVIAIRNKHK